MNKPAEARPWAEDAMALERSRLLEILKRTSYLESTTPIYHLASGIDSKHYIDCKLALSDPEARECLATIVVEMFRTASIDAIGGLELGAYPIATTISDKVYRDTGKKVRVFVVRKEKKTHGNTSLIAGDTKAGDRVLIVDDVITSGQSAIRAIDAVRAAGLKVEHVIAMVDREESNGRKNIEAKDVHFQALYTLNDLINFNGPRDKGESHKSDQKRPVRSQSSRVAATS
jgi:orotate phosphoribosyltransferase